jgi:glycerol uptake facilitator protein
MKEFTGEFIGTFVMVLFGCGSVAMAVLFGEYSSILQIGLLWGLAVALAIYLTRYLSCAHLNPAVSIAMVISKRMNAKKLPSYLLAQFLGAILAGFVLYLMFSPSIAAYESAHGIIRGSAASMSIRHVCSASFIPIQATRELSFPCRWLCSVKASVHFCCLSSSSL